MRSGRLLAIFLSLVGSLVFLSSDALAKKKKGASAKRSAGKVERKAAPQADTKAVSELMGPFKWGMTHDEVLVVLGKSIDDKNSELVKATTDVYEQDRIRKRAADEKKRIKDSLVRFEGKKTGLDVSIVGKELGHNNDESMMELWEKDPQSNKDQRRYFFFYEGKLWKMFITFNSEIFQGKTFADFASIMEARYGQGAPEVTDGVRFLYWRSAGYYLRAVDLTQFYGNFCIAISDESVEQVIHARREERNPQAKKGSGIIESVTEAEGPKDGAAKSSLTEQNSDVIDRIVGGGKK
ncbi:MAG: hypothetical protein HY698_03580 [Deltaproteobacteria bacterium]|nr:hypothetical protein [Deltaproteobacteria bacterium]